MFKKTADKIQYPQWVAKWPRYKCLDVYDRLLCGTFYDHLKYAFFDEKESGTGAPILLEERRPSTQFRLPSMVSRWSSRKLFAGRHRPKLRLPGAGDGPAAAKPKTAAPKSGAPAPAPKKPAGPSQRKRLAPLNKLLRRYKFWQKMGEVVFFGSVGSVAVTFKVELPGAGAKGDPKLALTIWKAKYCKPSFDEFGELAQLRVQYTTTPAQLRALNITTDHEGKALDDALPYWFIRDYLPDVEMTYKPIKINDWNPVDGFVGDDKANKELKEIDDLTIKHNLGFVPGQWFVNLPGGEGMDGECTWKDAIPNSIDLDYSLSQLGRGIRYNSAPQLVLIGNLQSGDITRGPMTALQMQAGYKEAGGDGTTIGAGDAKLLEMTGSGVDKALAYIDHLRNYALEQIAASRKDPDKMKAPLSGRAMEYLDEDSNDLVMELRSQYGEDGALPLLKKIATAAEVLPDGEIGTLTLQWPRMFQPTPDEVFALVQAFQIACDPLGKTAPGTPGSPAEPGGGEGKPGKPAVPPTDPVSPTEDEQLLTIQEARAYLLMNLDMGMLDLDLEDDAEDDDVDDSPTPPSLETSPVPDPLPIDELPPESTPGDDEGGQTADPPGMIVHPPSYVDA
jgi:hypothetical protein